MISKVMRKLVTQKKELSKNIMTYSKEVMKITRNA
jgi:hypothetical protein